MENNSTNIWPSFIDLSISFVVILTMILLGLIYHSNREKKKYEQVSLQQLLIKEQAKQLYDFSMVWGNPKILNIALDSSKSNLILGLKPNREIVFNSASIQYTYPKRAKETIKALTGLIKKLLKKKGNLIGRIMVEGHSDSRPIISSKSEFKSNWELSAARAGKVVREFLGDHRNGPLAKYYNKFLAIGYADTQPTKKGMQYDRRITIKITTSIADSLANNYLILNKNKH